MEYWPYSPQPLPCVLLRRPRRPKRTSTRNRARLLNRRRITRTMLPEENFSGRGVSWAALQRAGLYRERPGPEYSLLSNQRHDPLRRSSLTHTEHAAGACPRTDALSWPEPRDGGKGLFCEGARASMGPIGVFSAGRERIAHRSWEVAGCTPGGKASGARCHRVAYQRDTAPPAAAVKS
jgi:hypothetical protein